MKMLLIFTLTVVTTSIFAQTREGAIEALLHGLRRPIVFKGRPDERMDLSARMKHYQVPGLSMALIDEGKIALAMGVGATSFGAKGPITTTTRFQAASVSKAVAAVGVMSFVQAGILDLDEDVNLKLRSWSVPDTELTRKEKVTLRRLLSHTAGLNVHGFGGYPVGSDLPSTREILSGEGTANSPAVMVQSVPGQSWKYSGGGTTVVQMLLEDLAGRPFHQIMEETLIAKLGLKNSSFGPLQDTETSESFAFGHLPDGSSVPGGWHLYPESAAAGLWTTPSDLAEVAIEIQNAFLGLPGKILNTKTARSMLVPQMRESGLGPFVKGHGTSEMMFYHEGSNLGFNSIWISWPHRRQGVVIMVNSDNGKKLIQEVLLGLAEYYQWPHWERRHLTRAELPIERLSSFAGTYSLRGNGDVKLDIKVKAREGGLDFDLGPLGRDHFEPLSETRFISAEVGVELEFYPGPDGRPYRITIDFDENNHVDFIRAN